jgi:hypothetical protein
MQPAAEFEAWLERLMLKYHLLARLALTDY